MSIKDEYNKMVEAVSKQFVIKEEYYHNRPRTMEICHRIYKDNVFIGYMYCHEGGNSGPYASFEPAPRFLDSGYSTTGFYSASDSKDTLHTVDRFGHYKMCFEDFDEVKDTLTQLCEMIENKFDNNSINIDLPKQNRNKVYTYNEKQCEVMICKLFSGGYANDPNAIPHEVMNLYKADNGNSYLYIPPYGGYSTNTHRDVSYYVFTTSAVDDKMEIIFMVKSEDIEFVRYANQLGGMQPRYDIINDIHEQRDVIDLIKNIPISYGGHCVVDLVPEEGVWPVTFMAKKIYKPTMPIVLCDRFREYTFKKITEPVNNPLGISDITYNGFINDPSLWEEYKPKIIEPQSKSGVRHIFKNSVSDYKILYEDYYKAF